MLSGKGGTGKTSITAALASIAKNAVLCDNDVDAANLHLVIKPEILEQNIYEGAWIPKINPSLCTNCGTCSELCRFDAIRNPESIDISINNFKCEGCRLCERACPAEAITSERSKNNFWHISDTRFGKMVHARLGPGEENSGKLVSKIRKAAREVAEAESANWIINDGPPGIGCAAISSLTGTNGVLLVTEPSLSGFHDLKRLIELIRQFRLPALAIINKYDLHEELSLDIESYLRQNSIPLGARIPYSKSFYEAMIEGKTIIEFEGNSDITYAINRAWKQLGSLL